MIQALDVEGAFRGPFGFDRHTRAFVRELDRRGVAIRLFDVGEPGARGDDDEPPIDPWFESLHRPVGARVLLQFRMPHLLRPVPDHILVDYTMFEATRISPAWVEASRWVPLTVLPTESSRRAWLASGAPPERLRLCPLGVDELAFRVPATPLDLRLDSGEPVATRRTRFLNVSAIGWRKNLPGLLRVWLRATTPADDALLILKLSLYDPLAMIELRQAIRGAERDVGKSLAAAAPVLRLIRTLPDESMPRLYAAATHYLSLSHGEGWDLPMTEAAAAGLRLIAPDHSAYPTYLDPTVARLIPSREVPVLLPNDGPTAALFVGANWWEPDEEAAVAALRDAIAVRDAPAASARDRILRDFTWERAVDRLLPILAEAEAMTPRPRWRLIGRRGAAR